ncbi:MAG: GlxA family transcriptional regulator [Pseudomonadota bacterium]
MDRTRVTIVGVPEAVHSTVAGLADVFDVFRLLRRLSDSMPEQPPFEVVIAGPACTGAREAEVPFRCHTSIDKVDDSDLVIVPALMVDSSEWRPGAHDDVVDWLKKMHERGATLCSTCSGALILAETGLLDGYEATTHWAYAETFERWFPRVRLRLEDLLVTSGARAEFVMSGATGSWHDLALHVISERVGAAAAQTIARFLLLEWHQDGQTPYMMFLPRQHHGDAVVLDAQNWLEAHLAVDKPVETVIRRSGIPRRTFNRRFLRATGLTAIGYVQRLRIEAAKRRLEQNGEPIDHIAHSVGYDDPASFRRLFKRTTGITPGAYRRKLHLPQPAGRAAVRSPQ